MLILDPCIGMVHVQVAYVSSDPKKHFDTHSRNIALNYELTFQFLEIQRRAVYSFFQFF